MDFSVLIDELVRINYNDELNIAENEFWNSKRIVKIILKYKLDEEKKEKLYEFIKYLLKFKNNKLMKMKLANEKNLIDEIVFEKLLEMEKNKIKYASALIINYLNKKINYKSLNENIEILEKIFIKGEIIIPFLYGNDIVISEKNGKILYENGFAEKMFKILEFEYKINEKGKKFFKNIYIDSTPKEKETYDKMIKYEEMSKFKTPLEHEEYYNNVMKNIGSNPEYIKVARLHNMDFKIFFEEYDILIKYAIIKYGNNCKIRICSKETNRNIKFDGVIELENDEEKIEITSPFNDEEKKIQVKKLNNQGVSSVKIASLIENEEYIKKIIKNILNQKNSSNSYDETINLVIMFDYFDFLTYEQLKDIKYLKTLFEDFELIDYKFKSVSILVDRYQESKKVLEPRIIEIKKFN